jgi:hypothetical protein
MKTMRTYPEELKAKIIARLLPPNNEYILDVAKETGIPKRYPLCLANQAPAR